MGAERTREVRVEASVSAEAEPEVTEGFEEPILEETVENKEATSPIPSESDTVAEPETEREAESKPEPKSKKKAIPISRSYQSRCSRTILWREGLPLFPEFRFIGRQASPQGANGYPPGGTGAAGFAGTGATGCLQERLLGVRPGGAGPKGSGTEAGPASGAGKGLPGAGPAGGTIGSGLGRERDLHGSGKGIAGSRTRGEDRAGLHLREHLRTGEGIGGSGTGGGNHRTGAAERDAQSGEGIGGSRTGGGNHRTGSGTGSTPRGGATGIPPGTD